ncbi:glucose 1-dehydrogenase [Breoghania sp. L-A4]|uniref:SDR family NAD(P)-dependent oxidoreductase n=1 Tax=Breoghania sp. L-A4 TaxID=2304600 RepID=UPI000E359772|nr:glucose 1-dehydrogenase [Breoghania sp. L-A4]AXS41782.1 SDR family oxidoreductase [Breoghania sp. L-A4]
MTEISLPRPPSFRLDGKRALITGAGRGIGLGAAVGLADAGAHVILASRTLSEVEAAASAIRALGQSAEALELDVMDLDAVRHRIPALGPLDILLNNAGTNRPRPMVEVPEADFDAIMDLNVRAAYFVAQTVAKMMLAAGNGGSIINTSSQMGHVGSAGRSVYCASKFAVEGFTRAMAVELGPHNIRVNTICPTFIETPLTKPYFDDPAFKEKVLAKIQLGRVGTIEEISGPIVFLASQAASLITGSSLMIDGGWTAE